MNSQSYTQASQFVTLGTGTCTGPQTPMCSSETKRWSGYWRPVKRRLKSNDSVIAPQRFWPRADRSHLRGVAGVGGLRQSGQLLQLADDEEQLKRPLEPSVQLRVDLPSGDRLQLGREDQRAPLAGVLGVRLTHQRQPLTLEHREHTGNTPGTQCNKGNTGNEM